MPAAQLPVGEQTFKIGLIFLLVALLSGSKGFKRSAPLLVALVECPGPLARPSGLGQGRKMGTEASRGGADSPRMPRGAAGGGALGVDSWGASSLRPCGGLAGAHVPPGCL